MKTNKNHTQTTTKRSTNAATVNNTTQAPANEPAATTAAQEQTAETPDDYPATLIDITRLRTSPYNPRRSYRQSNSGKTSIFFMRVRSFPSNLCFYFLPLG